MIDTHMHLDLLDSDGRADEALAAAARVGVTDIIGIGVDPRKPATTRTPIQAPVNVYETLGMHPQNLTDEPDLLDALRALDDALACRSPRVVAVGETGLDARPNMPARHLQEHAFREQLRLAHKHGLPVVIHGVRRDGDVLRMVDDHIAAHGPLQGVWHGFSGSRDTMREAVKRGLHIAIGFVIVNDKVRRVREAVDGIPEDRLVVETDAPPFAPARLKDVVEQVARLRGVSPEQIAATTTANARLLFRLALPAVVVG